MSANECSSSKKLTISFIHPKNNCDRTNRFTLLCEETESNSFVCVFRSDKTGYHFSFILRNKRYQPLNSISASLVRMQLDKQRHLCVCVFVCDHLFAICVYWYMLYLCMFISVLTNTQENDMLHIPTLCMGHHAVALGLVASSEPQSKCI